MTEVERKLTDLLGAAGAGAELPERLRRPSSLLPATLAPTRRPMPWVGIAAAILLFLASAGVTAAQTGLLRVGWSTGAQSLAAQVRQAERSAPEIGRLSLAHPLGNAPVAAPYGMVSQPPGTDPLLHAGIDFSAAAGEEFLAAAAGTIAAVGSDPELGLVVVVTHGKIGGVPVSTWYGHVGRILVKTGDVVRAGHPLGTVSTTGLATGPTLHFEVRSDGLPVDPGVWLP